MSKNNVKNIEFVNSKIIDTLVLLSNEYAIPFDTLVNFAVLKMIDDIRLLRLVRTDSLDLNHLSERILS
jgi:hypothetical protein